MTTIQIELPDAMAQAAHAAGLLTPQALERLLTDALKRQQAADRLVAIQLHEFNVPPARHPS